MASRDVETKVVQVRFDNQKFERNIKATIKSTEQLDKNLQFKGSKKGIDELSKSLENLDTTKLDKDLKNIDKDIKGISISFKELLKIKVLSKIIDTVTRSTVNMLKTMTGVGNIKAGWDAYNESLTTTGGILNQVEKQGKSLQDVANAMDQLRWYADETSYSFQTMSDGIRQFAIAGVDLDKATSAVQGVANLAGSAKVFDPFKVQSAMDAISKAMQTGYMDTLKWTTLTNTAGIVTQDFNEKLLKAAAAQGTLIESGRGQYRTKKGGVLVTPENIRDTLSKRWVTSDVLTQVLGEYNSATETVKGFMTAIEEGSDEAWASVNKNFAATGKSFHSLEDAIAEVQNNADKYDESIVKMTENMNADNITTRQAAKLMKALGAEFDEVSYKAFMSSQETTSFSQAISYVGTAIKTSWQGVFQSMFGDVEKSTELWSDVSDKFYGIFVAPFNALEDQFSIWSEFEEGGAADFRKSIMNIIDVLDEFTTIFKTAFTDALGDDFTGVLKEGTLWLKNFTENLKNNETVKNILTAVAKVLANIVKIFTRIGKVVFRVLGSVVRAASPIIEAVSNIVLLLAEGFEWLVNMIEETGVLESIVGAIVKVIDAVAKVLRKIGQALNNSQGVLTFAAILQAAFDVLLWTINAVADAIVWSLGWISDLFTQTESGEEKVNKFAETMNWLKGIFEKLAAPFKVIIGYFKQLDFASGFKATIGAIAGLGVLLWNGIQNGFVKVSEWLKKAGVAEELAKWGKALQAVGVFFKELVITIFTPIIDAVNHHDIKALVGWVLGIVGIIALFKFIKGAWDVAYGAKKVLSAIADAFWAVEARLRAGIAKAIGAMVLEIAAALLIIVGAVAAVARMIDEYGATKLMQAVGITGILLLACAYLTTGLIIAAKYMRGSIRAGLMLFGFAGALALAMTAVRSLANIVKSIDDNALNKTIEVMWSLAKMFMGVMFVSRLGITTPLLISFAKVVLSIWALMGVMFWSLDRIAKYDTETINNGINIINTVMKAFLIVVGLMRLASLSIAIVKAKTMFDLGGIFIGISAMMASVALMIHVCRGITPETVKTAGTTVGMVILAALGIAALSVLAGFIPVKAVELGQVKIGKTLFLITMSVIGIIAALKMAASLTPEVIKAGVSRITALYAAIGGIAAGLLALSRFQGFGNWFKMGDSSGSFEISKSGLVKNSAGKNPVAAIILAITIATVAMVAMLKYVAGLSEGDFNTGKKRIFKLIFTISGIVAALMLVSKIPYKGGGKATIKLTGALIIILTGVIALAWILMNISTIPVDNIKAAAIVIGSIMGAIIVSLLGMSLAAKAAQHTKKGSILKTFGTIFVVIVAVAALANVIAVLAKYTPVQLQAATQTMIAIMGSLEAAILLLIGVSKIAQFVKRGSIYKSLGTLGIVVMAMLLIAYAIADLARFDSNRLWPAFGVISIMLGIVTLLTLALAGIGQLMNGKAWLGILAFATIIGILIGTFAIFVAVMNHFKDGIEVLRLFASLNWSQLIAAASAFAIVIGTITAALAILAFVAMATGPFILLGAAALILVLLAIAGTFAIFVAALNHSKTSFQEFADGIKTVADAVFNGLSSMISAFAELIPQFSGLILNLGDALSQVIDALGGFVDHLSGGITTVIKALSDAIHAANTDIIILLNTLQNANASDIAKLELLAAGLVALTATNIINGLGALGEKILNFFGINTDSPLESIIKSLDKIDQDKLDHFNTLVKLISQLPVDMKDLNNELKPYKDSISTLLDPIISLAGKIKTNEAAVETVEKFIKAIYQSGSSPIGYALAIKYIEMLKSLLESDIDIEPKITPVFDFTNFDTGLTYMRNGLSGLGTYYTAQRAQNDYIEARQSNGVGRNINRAVVDGSGIPGMSINVTQNFTDATMYSYQATRAMQNAVEDAISGVTRSGIGGFIKGIIGSNLGRPR